MSDEKINKRLDELEAEQKEQREDSAPRDLVLTACYEKTVVAADGSKRQVAVLFAEQDYIVRHVGSSANGSRHFVREPREGAIPISPDSSVLLDFPGNKPGPERA